MEKISKYLKEFFVIHKDAPSLPITVKPIPPPSVFQEQDLGKTILNLAFSATISLVVLSNNLSMANQGDPPLSLHFLAVAIMIAFAASFLAISLLHNFSNAARALEHVSIVSIVVAFFMLMGFLLPSNFKWVVSIGCVLSLLVYVAAHVEGLSVPDAVIEEG